MSVKIVDKNIYGKNGILLLAKGQKTTDAVIKKLQNLGNYYPEELNNVNVSKSNDTFMISQALAEKMNICDNKILQYSNEILSTIIFESKAKPWRIYVNALSNYVDWLYTHSIDVALISLIMAVELGFSENELWDIGMGAFLHDVGKLLIPKAILQKPGSLSDMEMKIIRQHCELGVSSLEACHFTKVCTDIVIQHHERLDGSGYPKGLMGDKICRDARIVMIADVVDAITSGRPYKAPRDMDMAIKILKEDEEKYSKEYISVLEKILKR